MAGAGGNWQAGAPVGVRGVAPHSVPQPARRDWADLAALQHGRIDLAPLVLQGTRDCPVTGPGLPLV
ncbi:MAG: hypothetical protein EON49_11890, partial [Acidovorax sp.]